MPPTKSRVSIKHQSGLSLAEVAISLAILALVSAGLIGSITKQTEQRRIIQTRQLLTDARDAVLAFSASHGRVPCPALISSAGQEAISSATGSTISCQTESGLLPAVTLGLSGIGDDGLLTDAWTDGATLASGQPLRAIRYGISSLTTPVTHALSSPSLGAPGDSTRRQAVQSTLNAGQGLFVCRSSAGVGAGSNRCGTTTNLLAANAVAVIWSSGINGNDPSQYSADEQQNAQQLTPRVYVNRTMAPVDAVGGEFDDLMIWISYPLLVDRLVSGGFVL